MSSIDWPAKWACVRERLRGELSGPVFEAWIAPLQLVSSDKDELKIGVARTFLRNWVSNHYLHRIDRAFRAEHVEPASLTVVVAASVAVGRGVSKEPVPTPVTHLSQTASEEVAPKGLWERMLHTQQTFDSFMSAESDNGFACSAVRAFAHARGGEVSLLYIHGDFGLGKTHLLNAAALEFKKRSARVLFLRAEDFMQHFLGAVYRKDILAFKEELRSTDVLIIDDIQHICRSSATANEFLYTINALTELRRRVVIAADRVPAALEGLGAEIKSRMSGGLVLQLVQPGRDTRLAILQHRAAEFSHLGPNVAIPSDVLERIADLEEASPRELVAICTKLATYSDLIKKQITIEVAEKLIAQGHAPSARTSIDDIQHKTAEFYKLDVRDFYSPMRVRRVARPRQVAMYLVRKLTTHSLPEIGRHFGDRDHTTVLHACRRVEALCREDPQFKQEVDFLSQMLSAHQMAA